MKGYVLIGFCLLLASCGGFILEEPPGSQTIDLSNFLASVTETTATITWTTNVPTTHLIEYGTSPSLYTAATFKSDAAVSSHTVDLAGLTAATAYYCRVRNFHASLYDTVSSEQPFTTTAASPPTAAQRLRGIWLIGGVSGNTYTPAIGGVDLYDPVTDTWYANVTALPTPVSFAGVASLDGKIYVIGGFDSGGNVVNTVQIYTVTTDTWTTGTNMPLAKANIDAVTVNDRIYVLGGTTLNATLGWSGSMTTYEYLPPSTWVAKTNFIAANNSNRFLLPFNDVIFNFGGRSAGPTPLNSHDGFAVSSPSPGGGLTTGTEVLLTANRAGMAGVMYIPSVGPATIAIVGGFQTLTGTTGNYIFQGAGANTALQTFQYLYYPFTAPAVWTNAFNNYPSPVGFGAAALYGSIMYHFGGTSNSSSASGLISVYSFDLDTLQTGSWQPSASMPAGRYGHAAVTVDQ